MPLLYIHEIYFSMCNKIYRNAFLNKSSILFIPLGPGKDQILWTEQRLFISWHAPIHHIGGMPGNKEEFSLNPCFLALTFFIAFIPFNKFINSVPITIITACLYMLLFHEPIRNKEQWKRIIFNSLITHRLCFKVIMDIVQTHASTPRALIHMSSVLKQSGTR